MDQQKFWRQLFARYVRGESQPAESKILDHFFEQQQQNAEVWEFEESPEQIRERMLHQVQEGMRPVSAQRYFRPNYGRGIAATLLMLLGLGYFFLVKKESPSADSVLTEVEWTFFQTKAGEQTQIILPDGSRVRLNYLSSIRYDSAHFSEQERKVYLEGEAFFEIQRDEQHPFIVETEHLSTRVLGTSFNVSTQDGHTAVAVASGEVEVSTDLQGQKQTLRLQPHQGASLDQRDKALVFNPQIPEEAFLWKEGILAFKALPMKKIISQLERAYGVRIQCDARLLHRAVTARYQDQPIHYVLDDLCFLLDASYEISTPQHISITSP